MKRALGVFLFVSCSLAALAQRQPTALSASVPLGRQDLNPCLAELEGVASATVGDLTHIHLDHGKLGWRRVWFSGKTHKDQAQVVASLRRNLTYALPSMIHDAQLSGGSVTTTFKLYNDVNVAYELLDALATSVRSHGRKEEYGNLSNDLAGLERSRLQLSAYIQQAASSLETNGRLPLAAAQFPRKIIVDDNIPEKRPARRKTASAQQ